MTCRLKIRVHESTAKPVNNSVLKKAAISQMFKAEGRPIDRAYMARLAKDTSLYPIEMLTDSEIDDALYIYVNNAKEYVLDYTDRH